MGNKVNAILWQRRDLDNGAWVKSGIELTGHVRDLRSTARAYRAWVYQETGEWWECEFREKPKPIRSRENPILEEFRDMLGSLLEPHAPSQAAWWLQLMEWDPDMENGNYWGESLTYEATPDKIEEAKRILIRIRDMAKE